MTNEESKQQAIINAYGKYYEEYKNFINEDGWCWVNTQVELEGECNHYRVDWKKEDKHYWRPKMLQWLDLLPISTKEYNRLKKYLYPKDNSKKFRRS